MKANWGARLLAALLGTLLSTCTQLSVDGPMMPEAEGGNLVLYVSNQSFALDPVDIKVYLDGVLAVNQDFYVKSQHNWIKFQFQLRGGTHEIRAVTKAGETQKASFFDMDKQRWCVVNFWYYPEGSRGAEPTPTKFTIWVYDQPVGFQ